MQSLEKFRTPNTNKAMGIEIECYIKGDPDDRYCTGPGFPKKGAHHGFFYATDDGSISPPSYRDISVEFVSQPLSAPWLKKEITKLGKKFHWEVNETCGVHVHVSRKWLSKERAEKIMEFLCGLDEDEVVALFGRTANHYCRYNLNYFNDSRYSTINIQNKNTIEFRMFKSGTPEWCCYCVAMVEYLITNWATLNIDACLAFRDMHKVSA